MSAFRSAPGSFAWATADLLCGSAQTRDYGRILLCADVPKYKSSDPDVEHQKIRETQGDVAIRAFEGSELRRVAGKCL
eukprot:2659417-Amphidinium_carterae.2